MRTVSYRMDDLKKAVIHIGRVAENEYTRVQIDAGDIYAEFPHASAALTVQPPVGDAYPAVVTRDGNLVIWDVKDSDLAYEGDGEFQLTFSSGDVVVKSAPGQFRVCRSILGEGEAPDPLEDFLAEAGEALTAIPETIGAAFDEITAEAETLPSGSSATASFDGETKVLTIGVPKGDKGDTGSQGPAGRDGADGKDGANGAPGKDGKDGADGAPGKDGKDGKDGADGQDGHTPVKGTDYWTAEDKAEIVAAAAADVVADIIDDTAGDGVTDKTWSADKLYDLNGAITMTENLIAPQYEDLTFPVSKNDYCIYNGELYAAKDNISTEEAWTSSHWNKKRDLSHTVGTQQSTISTLQTTAQYIFENYYQKPSGGIPATDLASGVIPSVPVQGVKINDSSVVDSNGIAQIPMASSSVLGAVMVNASYGISLNENGRMQINKPSNDMIKEGTSNYRPLVPSNQGNAVFYGLATAAGDSTQSASSNAVGTYTADALTKIQKMLGVYQAPWELIREDTVTNATEANIEITVDGNGNAFELTDIILIFETPNQETASAKGDFGKIQFYTGSTTHEDVLVNAWTQQANTSAHIALAFIEQKDGLLQKKVMLNTTQGGIGTVGMQAMANKYNELCPVKVASVAFSKVVITLVTGTGHYVLFGKRKWN